MLISRLNLHELPAFSTMQNHTALLHEHFLSPCREQGTEQMHIQTRAVPLQSTICICECPRVNLLLSSVLVETWNLKLETSSSWSGMRHIEICRHGCQVWWTQRASTVEHPLMPISKMTLCCKLFVEFSSSFACLYIFKLLREIDWSVCVKMKCLGRHFTPNRICQSWFGRYWNWVGLICSLRANQELMWACSASTYKSV